MVRTLTDHRIERQTAERNSLFFIGDSCLEREVNFFEATGEVQHFADLALRYRPAFRIATLTRVSRRERARADLATGEADARQCTINQGLHRAGVGSST